MGWVSPPGSGMGQGMHYLKQLQSRLEKGIAILSPTSLSLRWNGGKQVLISENLGTFEGLEITPSFWVSLCLVAIAQGFKWRCPPKGPSGTVAYKKAQTLGRGTQPDMDNRKGKKMHQIFIPFIKVRKKHIYIIKWSLLDKVGLFNAKVLSVILSKGQEKGSIENAL